MIHPFRSLDLWQVRTFDGLRAIQVLRDRQVEIHHWKNVDQFTYQFWSAPIYRKTLKGAFLEIKRIKRRGPFSIIENLFQRKTTLIALVTAILLFFFLHSRIMLITFQGDSKAIEDQLRLRLEELGLRNYQALPGQNELLTIEKTLFNEFYHAIEELEIRQQGVVVHVRFTKRRVAPTFPPYTTNIYATKDGIIRYFLVESGVKAVKELDFVRKGTLLIKDTITTSDGEEIWIGSKGKVYANTWYLMTLTLDNREGKYDQTDAYLTLLDKARARIAKEISGNDEKIEQEKILQFEYNNSKMIMKVHYTLLEDITR